MRRSIEAPRSGRRTAVDQRRALRRLLRGLPEPVPPPTLLARTLAEVRRLRARPRTAGPLRRRPAVPFQDRLAGERPGEGSEESDDVAERRLA